MDNEENKFQNDPEEEAELNKQTLEDLPGVHIITDSEIREWDEELKKKQKENNRVSFRTAAIVTVISVIVSFCLGSLAAISFSGISGYNSLGLSREAWEKLQWGVKSVKDTYYGEIDENEIVDGMLLGMSIGLDDYSLYMPKNDAESFIQSVDGEEYSGVGLYIQNDVSTNTIKVIAPLSDSPAERAGIKTGDTIAAVDGVPVLGNEIDKASDMMMGKSGTTVKVTVIKAGTGETKVIELTREKIKLETVISEMLDDNIGYIQVTQFGTNTYDEFVEHYNELCDMGMEKLIIDLRNNAGGYFNQAVNMADIFIEPGKMIVYTKDKNGETIEYKAQTEAVEIEMVIISNEGTASASEVFIGALCDHDKATLVGKRTYGKGVTQAMSTYKDGSAFKITDSKYYTPSGDCIHEKGIEPDIEVEYGETEDMQLKAAIEALK